MAKAWVDKEFKREFIADFAKAAVKIGFPDVGSHVIALECGPFLHHVVVCTLCSCYPWSVLGLPPTWYKSAAYRSRVVKEPRKVLANLGTRLPEATIIRVWDSTAETRFIVVPERPQGTEGWTKDRLIEIISRDSMIGVSLPQSMMQEA